VVYLVKYSNEYYGFSIYNKQMQLFVVMVDGVNMNEAEALVTEFSTKNPDDVDFWVECMYGLACEGSKHDDYGEMLDKAIGAKGGEP